MVKVQEGQCGLCAHFGEEHRDEPMLIQIVTRREAPEDLIDVCGHPQLKPLRLQVTPISSCSGFEPARASA